MTTFLRANLPWVILAVAVLAIVLTATIYSFWNKRYIDTDKYLKQGGPREGEAANAQQVRRDHAGQPSWRRPD